MFEYICHLLILIAIYSLLGISLDLLLGFGGMFSVAQGAFFGLGAYASALVSLKLAPSLGLALVAGAMVPAVVGSVLLLPALRLKGDEFAIATFAIQVVIVSLLRNVPRVTGGNQGLVGIPVPEVLGFNLTSRVSYLLLTSLILGAAFLLLRWLVKSPFGRVLMLIREDETQGRTLGKNVPLTKGTALVVSAAVAGMAGGVYAFYFSTLAPNVFDVSMSIFLLAAVVVGGAGSLLGPIAGVAILVLIPEALRFVGLPSDVAATLHQIIYGVALIAVVMFRPRGIAGQYDFSVE